MVKITNGVNVFEVTKGAFDGVYSRQGYTLVEENRGGKDKVAETNSAGGNFLTEIVEKPISQWNKEEVKKFASLKGIDISGTKSINEAKDIIKNFLD